ncbi:cadherin repeat domain-containing protein [Brevundimonas sp. PAMC22021]|uniref:cadherin repeat domain-containing protein n=1 Tax=Brevundimonas sp. PAMC22021 TaxID=2861285 RepID=UPI001C637D2F|nr:cadherin repeat domain-containing protein [Brevundimonas sp. PAMC22021]QYF87033.1 hypothetical protein KY493_00440 [Brevundimonas sp. PAMC22021]
MRSNIRGWLCSASLVVLAAGLSEPVAAQTAFDVAGAPLSFAGSGTGTGTGVGSSRDYANVINIGGVQIDARVTLTNLDRATLTTFDSTSQPYAQSSFLQPNLQLSAAGGSATFRIDFLSNGQPVELQNFYTNTYDLDGSGGSAGGRQYTDFNGFASFSLATGTQVVRQSVGGGTRFITTIGSNQNFVEGSDDFNRIRARVFYTSASSVTVSLGDTGASGAAYFGLDFSIGYNFNNVVADTTAPVVAAGQTFSYVEDRPANAAIGTVAASDAIGVTAYRFAPTGTQTSSDGYYAINSAGQVRLTPAGASAGVPQNDYDTAPNSFTYAVQAGDAAGNWSSAIDLTFNVTAAAPIITGPSAGAGAASSSVSVNENQTTAAAFGANRSVTWSITGGADAAKFAINSTGGALTFVAAPDFEDPSDANTDNIYALVVTATDAGGLTASQTVAVTVLDVMDAAPVITGPSGDAGAAAAATSVDENQTAVATLNADQTVTWSITGGADASRFAIDPATGVVTFVAAPDYEAPTDANVDNAYVLAVTATGAGGLTATQTVTVTVRDLLDTAPIITGPSGGAGAAAAATLVDENQTAVAALSADQTVTWSITGGADASRFAIDAATGVITFVAAPDYEAPTDANVDNAYVLAVTATGTGGLTTSQTLTVTVRDLLDTAPVITGPSGGAGAASSATSVNENQTAVATLGADQTVTWSIAGGDDDSRFAIDPATGAITFVSAPDYEAPTDTGANNSYLLVVTATGAGGRTGSQTLTVSVVDVLDGSPVITGPGGGAGASTSAVSVNENQTAAATLSVDRPVTWSITGGADAGKFTVNGATGALTFVSAPDYEAPTDADADNAYVVIVSATGANGATAAQTLTVTILDLLDTAPVLTGPSGGAGATSSATSVNENQATVATLTADQAVAWSITGGVDAARFAIDAATGSITFIAAADYEAPADADGDNIYRLAVTGTGVGGLTSTQTVTITVLDVLEGSPIITGPGGSTGAATSAVSVNENQSATTTFSANRPVTWSISGGADAGKFTIDATGALTFVSAPDYEAPADANSDNAYVVIVSATDTNGATAAQTATVTVLDVLEGSPIITGPGGSAGASASVVSVNENQSATTTFSANRPVTWSISGGADAGKFTIDATGALTFVSAPDYEAPADANSDNAYVVTVSATDTNGATAAQTATVTVLDVLEGSPIITGPGGSAGASASVVSVDENQTAAATFNANRPVTWSISGGADAGKFTIDGATGVLSFVSTPDFEAPADADGDNAYLVRVTATDANGTAATQALTVTVLNIIDTAPVISGPSGGAGAANAATSVDENQTAVTTLSADTAVTWSITGGVDASAFAIDPATGVISFMAPPDFEGPTDADADNDYLLNATATGAGGQTSAQIVTVTVQDVLEGLPVITAPGAAPGASVASLSIKEGVTPVTTLGASRAVTWSISGGPDAGRFAIEAATGGLTFVSAPDFEAPADDDVDNVYVVVASATDAGGVAALTLNVTVLDVIDTPPVITAPDGAAAPSNTAIRVDETATTVAAFNANRRVTWSISGGPDAARFLIDASTGALAFVAVPDFEAPQDADADNVYLITVTATDDAGLSTSQAVTVTVADLNDNPPEITTSEGPLLEGAVLSVEDGSLRVVLLGADASVRWSIAGGADAARFTIDPGTGELKFIAAPDFDAPADADGDNDYTLVILATGASSGVARRGVIVRVQAVDITGPVITGPDGALGAATSEISIREGTQSLGRFLSNEPARWSLDGEADAALFAMDPTTGALSFIAAPDYENPGDLDRDNTYRLVVRATDALGNASQQTVAVRVTDVDEVSARFAAFSGQLRGEIRSYAFRSLGDMLAFNEGLVRQGSECHSTPEAGTLGRGMRADQTHQETWLDWNRTRCDQTYRLFTNAAVSVSHTDGGWSRRGLGSVRVERALKPNVTVGVGLLGSFASDELPGFIDSEISDHSLQANGYVGVRLAENLRAGAFAGIGRGWYDLQMTEAGLAVSGETRADRRLYGAMLSGDVHLAGVKLTTDAILSRAKEDLGVMDVVASADGEARDIEFALGDVDMTRLSIPVTSEFALPHREGSDWRTLFSLSPGLLCEDTSADGSVLVCGYQFGGRLNAEGRRGGLHFDYRWESVNDRNRSIFGLGYGARFGPDSTAEWGLDLTSGIAEDQVDHRAMFNLRLSR